MSTWIRSLACALALSACVRPAEERYDHNEEVGQLSQQGFDLQVVDGLAAVRSFDGDDMVLWAQAPVIEMEVVTDGERDLRLEIRNCMPDGLLDTGSATLAPVEQPRPTWCVFDLRLPAGASRLRFAPPDWDVEEPFRFADMGDIQKALPEVDEVFDRISEIPELRFVMSTGDVVERGEPMEYELFQEKLEALDIPFYSTIGNHELTTEVRRWHDLFGRYSIHFRFKGVDYSYVDSGNATLDPLLYDELQGWLEEGRDRLHIFGTHYPIIDPVGVRYAGFRSRNEASKLLARLADAKVDLTLYGHVHSYYEFENAGIPAYISGGGGAYPELFDGIDRHFLVIEVDPVEQQVLSVEVERVDEPYDTGL